MPALFEVDLQRTFHRRFVPQDVDARNWAHLEPLFTALLERKPGSAAELERWLVDCSEVIGAFAEASSNLYVAMTTRTDDPAREADYQKFLEEVVPPVKRRRHELLKAYFQNPFRKHLPKERYEVLNQRTATRLALFRPGNVTLETEDALLAKDYQKIRGAMNITIRGQELTLPQSGKLMEEQDRPLRQEVWERRAARALKDKDVIDDIYDRQIALRTRMATNAGFANYRDYAFPRNDRYDYTPEDCYRFHEAVERTVLPVVEQIVAKDQRQLRLKPLRPWDTSVDPLGRPPLRPFSSATELIQGAREIFGRVHPEFGRQFGFIAQEGLLDLENRKGKAPGGYQTTLQERRVPFIFMNAVGSDHDIRTLLHEGGHAFHMLAARAEPLIDYRHSPIEFGEVASMSMELLATPHLEVFYRNPEERGRALRKQLEDVVTLFPWIACIDAFQHWVYTHPEHTREQRTTAWLELHRRFFPFVDWTGLEEQRGHAWHFQPHLFTSAFYYIEYGIAQIGALQIWMRSRDNYSEAVERYWSALSLGGTRPLPELFAAAGAEFRFDAAALEPLMAAISEELCASTSSS